MLNIQKSALKAKESIKGRSWGGDFYDRLIGEAEADQLQPPTDLKVSSL